MNSKPVELYECDKCKLLHREVEGAEKCCTCPTCGVITPNGSFSECTPCQSKWRHEIFLKKVQYVPFDPNMVYCYDDRFFFGEDPFEYLMEQDSLEDWPKYLETTEVEEFILDPADVLENALQDHHEDAYDCLVDVKGFEDFINSWVKKQTMKSYMGVSHVVTKLSDFPDYEGAKAEFIELHKDDEEEE